MTVTDPAVSFTPSVDLPPFISCGSFAEYRRAHLGRSSDGARSGK